MKKLLLIFVAVLAVQTVAVAPAAEPEERLNILLTGGPKTDLIRVSVSADGTTYVISSVAPLEAPPGICIHSDEEEKVLTCEAARIASFEVNAGAGNDYIVFSSKVPVPLTLRGGPGDDHLYGGSAADKLIGGAGNDRLYGRGGGDWIYGGPGNDIIYGGPGDDRLFGGPGSNEIYGGSGKNVIVSLG